MNRDTALTLARARAAELQARLDHVLASLPSYGLVSCTSCAAVCTVDAAAYCRMCPGCFCTDCAMACMHADRCLGCCGGAGAGVSFK